MAEEQSKIKPVIEFWQGINQRISSTNLEAGTFADSNGVFNLHGKANRLFGKHLQSLQTGRILAIYPLQRIVIVQTTNKLHAFTLEEMLGIEVTPPEVGDFSPSDLTGLKLWLKADAIPSLSDNDPIATWPDSSSESNDATQSSSSLKPIFKTNQINSLPVVRFDGTDDILAYPTIVSLSTTTVFVVSKQTLSFTNYQALVTIDNNFSVYSRLELGADQWGVYDGSDRNSGQTSFNTFAIHSIRRTGSNTELRTNNANLVTVGQSTTNAYVSTIGGDTYPAQYFGGDIAEILIYDTALNSTDRQKVESYLNGRYGIY